MLKPIQSPPAWGRGLKPALYGLGDLCPLSPPAWGRGLKPALCGYWFDSDSSPPAWGRGLKQINHFRIFDGSASPPAWGRGLKRSMRSVIDQHDRVAPRVGAWIETHQTRPKTLYSSGRPPRGGVD